MTSAYTLNAPGPAGARRRLPLLLLHLALLCLLSACGGGGGGDSGDRTGVTPPPLTPGALTLPAPAGGTSTTVRILSASGDTLGGGTSRSFTLADAGVQVEAFGPLLRVSVRGDDFWDATIRTSTTGNTVVEGQHTGLQQNLLGADAAVGMDWQREGERCSVADAVLSVDKVRYVDGQLAEVDLRMAQRCSGAAGALQAQVRWVAAERPVRAAAPAVPADLWRPAAGRVPATGNVVLIDSTGTEPVFAGRSRVFTDDDALLSVDGASTRLELKVRGYETWFAQLRGIDRPEGLQPGFYNNLRGFIRGYNPARGALEWYTGVEQCTSPRGWLAVDRLTYERGALVALELRFEQRCLQQPGVLRGLVRWQASQRRLPPAPGPAPAGLWAPAAAALPATGNHLLLSSDPGDFVGGGITQLLTSANSQFVVYDDQGTLRMRVGAPGSLSPWTATFRSRVTAGRLEAGYRGTLQGPSANPAVGGLTVGGDSRGCDFDGGWFMVDDVRHRHGVLRQVALRFEQRCKNSTAALRGSLRWSSDDPTITGGPADPPWPEATYGNAPAMPASGSALLLESRGREFVGGGSDWLFTAPNALVSAGRASVGPSHTFGAQGDGAFGGTVWLPAGQSRLQPGRVLLTGARLGTPGAHTFEVYGEGRACNTTTGWYEVDDVAYNGEQLTRLALRFEQYCDGSPYPLLGQFRWSADDPVPRGVLPQAVPAELWAPPAGAMPTTGISLYLQSNPGGFVGDGQTLLLQPAPQNVLMYLQGTALQFILSTPGIGSAIVQLQPPRGDTALRPGYYPGTVRDVVGNPLRMGASLSVDSRGCNSSDGWVAVDDIAYDNQGLVRIALRLMQLCDDAGPPAFAALRWARP
jgi:hypothetical protein